MSNNLALELTSTARAYGQRPAIRLDKDVVTYAELDQATARVAGLLRELGVEPGDAVGVMLPNVPYFAFAYYGVLRAGGVVVPMNVLLKQREVAFHLGDSQAKLVFAWHEFAQPSQRGAAEAGAKCEIVAPGEFERLLARTEPATGVVDRTGDDTAVILYTSGTTGTPKGAELTHSNLASNVEVVVRMLSVVADDVILGALPLMIGWGEGSELRHPLGITMVGGLIFSQALTLFTTPVIYLAFDALARRVEAGRGRGSARRDAHAPGE